MMKELPDVNSSNVLSTWKMNGDSKIVPTLIHLLGVLLHTQLIIVNQNAEDLVKNSMILLILCGLNITVMPIKKSIKPMLIGI
jgi:hypothetical protein